MISVFQLPSCMNNISTKEKLGYILQLFGCLWIWLFVCVVLVDSICHFNHVIHHEVELMVQGLQILSEPKYCLRALLSSCMLCDLRWLFSYCMQNDLSRTDATSVTGSFRSFMNQKNIRMIHLEDLTSRMLLRVGRVGFVMADWLCLASLVASFLLVTSVADC